MALRTRLRRLERGFPDPGCPACRDRRGLTALVRSRRLADGTTAPKGDRPAPCARCGEVAERVIEVVEVVVEAGENPGENECKGGCAVPLDAGKKMTWQKARKRFEELMKKAGKTFGDAPAA